MFIPGFKKELLIQYLLVLSFVNLHCCFRSSKNKTKPTHGQNTYASKVIVTFNAEGDFVTESFDMNRLPPLGTNPRKLEYLLYTRSNGNASYGLIPNNEIQLNNSPINLELRTKILIHGWQSSCGSYGLNKIKDAFLAQDNVNVICFDWSPYSRIYLQAFLNIKSISKHFADFINFLIDEGLAPENVHIIGHSLGAHLAGFTGRLMRELPERVTGLDPAGPMFTKENKAARLNNKDARFVDAIHTSTLAGINCIVGHVDFFPHGGSDQPACANNAAKPGCDHIIVLHYYYLTIFDHYKYPSVGCDSEESAKLVGKENDCDGTMAYMGDGAPSSATPGIVYYVALRDTRTPYQ